MGQFDLISTLFIRIDNGAEPCVICQGYIALSIEQMHHGRHMLYGDVADCPTCSEYSKQTGSSDCARDDRQEE